MRKPKTLAGLKADPRVADVFRENDGDGPSYWLHLKCGWQVEYDPQNHTIHEKTLAAVLMAFRPVPCSCESCAGGGRG